MHIVASTHIHNYIYLFSLLQMYFICPATAAAAIVAADIFMPFNGENMPFVNVLNRFIY